MIISLTMLIVIKQDDQRLGKSYSLMTALPFPFPPR